MSKTFVKLGDVCEVQNGFAFDSKCFSSTPQSGMPLIRIRDILRGWTETYYTGDFNTDFIVKKGDFLIGMDGDFNIGQWKSDDALLNQRVCRLIPSEKINVKFLYYYLPTELQKINDDTTYATVKHLSSKQVKSIRIPNLTLSEQQRIVDILDAEFAKIDALKENAEKNLQNAKDLFQAVLRKELEPKEGWDVSTLKELLKLTSGDNLTAKSIITGDYPVYGGNGIMGYHNRYNLDGLNVLVGRVGALCGNVRLIEGKIWFTDNCFLVHDKTGVFHLPYLAYALQNANLRQYATQAAQPVVSNASMKDVQLSIPPTVKEQCKIVYMLDKIKENSEVLQHNYDKTIILCNDLKQALLRKAFNGEL